MGASTPQDGQSALTKENESGERYPDEETVRQWRNSYWRKQECKVPDVGFNGQGPDVAALIFESAGTYKEDVLDNFPGIRTKNLPSRWDKFTIGTDKHMVFANEGRTIT